MCQSFILQNLNCKFCTVVYPGHPNKLTELCLWRSWLSSGHPNQTWDSDEEISDYGFKKKKIAFNFIFKFYFWVENPTTCWTYTKTMYLQIGENTKWAKTCIWCLLLTFNVVYWDIWNSEFCLICQMGFRWERAAAGLGPSGLYILWNLEWTTTPKWETILMTDHPNETERPP